MLNTVRRIVYAAALLVIAGLGWFSPQALAQVPCIPGLTCPSPDTTPPTVSITSPAFGATVSGTITVSASASDDRGVAGVQFRLDGVDGGAEDTVAPYSISWDTTTAANGAHTLTAVARDAAGNRRTSDPVTVTVSNNASPPDPVTRHEESDPSVSFSGVGWNPSNPNWFAWSGGSAMESMAPNSQATFTFTGTSVTWIGYRGGSGGIARVSVDGAFAANVDLFARIEEIHAPIYTAKGLGSGSHTITIEVTGLKNPEAGSSVVVVDAFDVPAPVVSHLQDTDPDVAYTAGWARDSGPVSWSGGMAMISDIPGAQATLPFNGTSISWIGARRPSTGIARVFLDGVFAGEIDTYSATNGIQGVVFTSPALADGPHTLTIEATGRKNDASTSAQIVVDAFDVRAPGTRFQETDPSVVYTGEWIQGNLNRSWSEGTISESNVPGAQAAFTFTGTSVSWIGCRKFTTGIAEVYLDGVFMREIDTFAPAPQEGYQDTIFTASGLAPGTHTLTIVSTGRKNPAASNGFVVVDAFDVRP